MKFTTLVIVTITLALSLSHIDALVKYVPLTAEYIKGTTNPASALAERVKFNDDGTMGINFISGSAMYPEKWTDLIGVSDLNSGEWTSQIDMYFLRLTGAISNAYCSMCHKQDTSGWPHQWGYEGGSNIMSFFYGTVHAPQWDVTKCGSTTSNCNLINHGDPIGLARMNKGIMSLRMQRLLSGKVKFTFLTGDNSATEGDTVWIEATTKAAVNFDPLNSPNVVPISMYCQYVYMQVTQMRISNTDSVAGPIAGGGGDPHFNAFGNIFYTWQGSCDVILMKMPKWNSTDPEISVHIRTGKVRQWSAIHAVAVKIEKDVIEIGSTDGKLLLNGRESESIESDLFSVSKYFSKKQRSTLVYNFDFRHNKRLEVKVNKRTQMIFTTLSGNFPDSTEGLLGSPNNPGLFLRNGTNMTGKDVNKFAESWQINDSDPDLFQKPRVPQFPEKCQYYEPRTQSPIRKRRLKEIHMVSIDEAASACAAHQTGPMKEFCIDDVLNTGDIEAGKDSFYG